MALKPPLAAYAGALTEMPATDTIPPANLGTGTTGDATYVLCSDGVFRQVSALAATNIAYYSFAGGF